MLKIRVIPTLLIRDRDLVKSLKFKNHIYVGDPINTLKIFNEKKCDEIFIYDVSDNKSQPIDFEYLRIIAAESRMPIGYGGRINSIEDIEKILSIGIEKVSLNSTLFTNESILLESSKKFGKQSLVVTLDIKKNGNEYFIYSDNGKQKQNNQILDCINYFQNYAGELIIQSIDNDGMMQGYDLELFNLVSKKIKIPFTFLGGAGNFEHLKQLALKKTVSACGSGSYFIFKKKRGVVLINYINSDQKDELNQIFEFC